MAAASVKPRRFHRDFVDCLIMASDLEHCGGLVAEEEFKDEPDLVAFIGQRSPSFGPLKAEDLAGTG